MKNIISKYLGLAMMAAVALTSCQADMEEPAYTVPVATMHANTTISDLKTEFAGKSVLCPMKDEANQTPYIIKGKVISSDASGNIYKSLVIQDETAAIALSINYGSMYVEYRIGQEVVLNVTGLYIGYYRGLQQIGWLGTPYDGETQLGFMAWDLFRAHSEMNGAPNQDVEYVGIKGTWPEENPYCIVTSFSELPSSGKEFRDIQSQLVEFRNVSFEDGGVLTYAPYQESVNRNIKDASGATLIVRTSGYSNFYNQLLPEGTGNVRGILSYYGDAWQLLLRDTRDVMINSKGQKDEPYTVEEAVALQNEGNAGWVEAYIVGSVKAGVQSVTSNNDIIFGAGAELDNNLVVAASADETDFSKCLCVELPQGSDLRKYGNLVDNPAVYKKSILVNGDLTTFMGMPGVTGKGTAYDFEIDGVVIGGGDQPSASGDGTKENPYTVEQIQTSTANQADVWVEGYVVGYIADKSWDTAVFDNEGDPGSTNYTNGTNLILSSATTDNASAANSIPVGLASGVRDKLAMSKNPAIYGAKVKVKGSLEAYFGRRGVKSVSEYVIEGDSPDTPDTPVTPAGVIYSALGKSESSLTSGWTYENVTVPSAASSGIWSWKQYNGNNYLNGSAYISGKAYESLAYAVSGEIDLTGYKTVSVKFDHAAKFQTTLRQLCGFSVREAGTTAWTDLVIPTWPEAGSWTFVSSGSIDLSAYAGKKIQIALKYASSTAGADTWEVQNLEISASK